MKRKHSLPQLSRIHVSAAFFQSRSRRSGAAGHGKEAHPARPGSNNVVSLISRPLDSSGHEREALPASFLQRGLAAVPSGRPQRLPRRSLPRRTGAGPARLGGTDLPWRAREASLPPSLALALRAGLPQPRGAFPSTTPSAAGQITGALGTCVRHRRALGAWRGRARRARTGGSGRGCPPCRLAKAAGAQPHTRGSFNDRHLRPSSGGRKSKVKALVVLVPSKAARGDLVQPLLLLLVVCWQSLVVLGL